MVFNGGGALYAALRDATIRLNGVCFLVCTSLIVPLWSGARVSVCVFEPLIFINHEQMVFHDFSSSLVYFLPLPLCSGVVIIIVGFDNDFMFFFCFFSLWRVSSNLHAYVYSCECMYVCVSESFVLLISSYTCFYSYFSAEFSSELTLVAYYKQLIIAVFSKA